MIIIPNDKLMTALGEDVTMREAFHAADNVLRDVVAGISEVVTRPGFINLDFADVKNIMGIKGIAMMGSGFAQGIDRARLATEQAISNPLLDNVTLDGARGVLVNITTAPDCLKMSRDPPGPRVGGGPGGGAGPRATAAGASDVGEDDHGVDAPVGQSLASAQARQLQQHAHGLDPRPGLLEQADGGRGGAAGGQDVVDDQDPLAGHDRLRAQLHAGRAVLQVVVDVHDRAGELAPLAHGEHADV